MKAFVVLFALLCLHHHIGVNSKTSKKTSDDFDLDKYNSYEAMISHLKELEKEHHQMSVQAIGLTAEKRTIYMVKISSHPDRKKKAIFLDANHHAREWVTSAILMNLIETIVESPDELVEHVDWYIVPMVNPDGYEYSRKFDKTWRKNRSVSKSRRACIGVDLNRNYPIVWGMHSSLDGGSRCDADTYAGPRAASEEETQALIKSLRRNKKAIEVYVTAHSHGAAVLYPYGYKRRDAPPNEAALRQLGERVARAMSDATKNGNYTVAQSSSLYLTSGSSDDYAYSVLKIPYVYTIEYTQGYGFDYPEKELKEAYEESMAGFRTIAEFVGRHS